MLKTLGEHERAVVLRMGRLARVAGPGRVWLIPFVETAQVLDLDRTLPGWRGLSPRELAEVVTFIATHYLETPTGLAVSDVRDKMREAKEAAERMARAVALAAAGQELEAVDLVAERFPDAGRDVLAVHLKFLGLASDRSRDLVRRLARSGEGTQRTEAALLEVAKLLDVEPDLGKRWAAFFAKQWAAFLQLGGR